MKNYPALKVADRFVPAFTKAVYAGMKQARARVQLAEVEAAIRAGDVDRALAATENIEVRLNLPYVKAMKASGEVAAARLPKVRLLAFNPDQERDESGKWTSGGGNGGSDNASNQTDTPEFKEWFGKSKVVNTDGSPKVVYKSMYAYDWTKEDQATGYRGPILDTIDRPEAFPTFDKDDPQGVKIAGFFGDKDTANRFSTVLGKGQAIYPVYLNIEKPFVIDAKGSRAADTQFGAKGKPFRDAIRSGKYDGVLIKNTSDEGDLFVALKPEQIKSSLGNTGKFSKRSKLLSFASVEAALRAAKRGDPQKLSMKFDQANPRAVRWAKDRSAKLVTSITTEQRKALRNIITRSILEGFDPRQASILIRNTVGLTVGQSNAVANAYGRMIISAGKSITLGSKRIRVPEFPSDEFLDAQMHAYADRLHKYRAETIARTETMTASNQGQLELWQQAVDEGQLTGTEEKEWIVTDDTKLCPICEPFAGQRVPMTGSFSADGLEIDAPPAHPNCRCTIGLYVPAVARAATSGDV
jgi:SPP1 gp7 family putative phage head morphogenesis protein